jgi:hypothetical protein
MKPAMKPKSAASTKTAKKAATAGTGSTKKASASSGMLKSTTARAYPKVNQSPATNVPKRPSTVQESPSAYSLGSETRSFASRDRQTPPPRSMTHVQAASPSYEMQELPDSLEPFSGWSTDPTDQEVKALTKARKVFSYDRS